jgi:hypothetical protein
MLNNGSMKSCIRTGGIEQRGMTSGMIDLEEFKRIDAQAKAETERLLGAKPDFNAGPTSLLVGVAVFMVLELFSAVPGLSKLQE